MGFLAPQHIPHPLQGKLYVKLRDDPEVVNVALLNVKTAASGGLEGLGSRTSARGDGGHLAETLQHQVLDARRRSMRAAFARAITRAETREIWGRIAAGSADGTVYYRALFGHAPISHRVASDVLEYLLRIAARRDQT